MRQVFSDPTSPAQRRSPALGLEVVILAEEKVTDVRQFVQALAEFGVTSAFMVPALLKQVLALAGSQTGLRLRAVTVSGGALTPELAEAYFTAFPDAILINNYGSTETGTSAAMKVYTSKSDVNRIDLNPATRPKGSMISDERKGKEDGEEETEHRADHRCSEAT